MPPGVASGKGFAATGDLLGIGPFAEHAETAYRRLSADGYVGHEVRSFVQGAVTDDGSFGLWFWGSGRPTWHPANDNGNSTGSI